MLQNKRNRKQPDCSVLNALKKQKLTSNHAFFIYFCISISTFLFLSLSLINFNMRARLRVIIIENLVCNYANIIEKTSSIEILDESNRRSLCPGMLNNYWYQRQRVIVGYRNNDSSRLLMISCYPPWRGRTREKPFVVVKWEKDDAIKTPG